MPQVRSILIVEDDVSLRVSLMEQIGVYSEFVVREAGDLESGLSIIGESDIDLVVMDIGLPDGDGCDFVKKLRATGFMKPVIMLTGRDAEDDVVAGLDAGANDYVSKPFQFSILLARIRAHLRQHEFSEDVSLKMATYTFYPGSKILVGSTGAKTRLTEKETAVLRYLHRANGGVVSRDELLREVWGYNARVSTHTLETHIYRLRQKIAAVPGAANLLVTDIGGYRLEA